MRSENCLCGAGSTQQTSCAKAGLACFSSVGVHARDLCSKKPLKPKQQQQNRQKPTKQNQTTLLQINPKKPTKKPPKPNKIQTKKKPHKSARTWGRENLCL